MSIGTVGFIGLGTMGRPMSRHLVERGYKVTGYDPDPQACERSSAHGLTALPSPKDVAAGSDMVIILVGFETQVESVLFDEDGILTGAKPGLIIGLSSTVTPSYARGLAERLVGRDVRLLDMPTTRSHMAAETGQLLVLGGGDSALFDECRPILTAFATDIFNLGPFGSGQVGKMVNNTILWACMAANNEGLEFGARLGVDQEKMREALKVSSAANFALIEAADMRPIPWAEKDMIIAQSEADKIRYPVPLTGHVKELIKAFKLERGYPTPGL
jgi:3-hydroxyisobutyrate dehydrogenase-like beta-hydroxyacid dehydrogenase